MTNLIPRREEILFPLEDRINKVFDEVFSGTGLLNGLKSRNNGFPRMDILTSEDRYRVEVALPGVNPNDLSVEILPNSDMKKVLKISGKMEHDYEAAKAEYHVKELRRSHFQRLVTLPSDLEGEPEAVLKNGLLSLTWVLKKDEPDDSIKQIQVKVE